MNNYKGVGLGFIWLLIFTIPFFFVSAIFSRQMSFVIGGYFIAYHEITLAKKKKLNICYLTLNPFYNPILFGVINFGIWILQSVTMILLIKNRDIKEEKLSAFDRISIREQTDKIIANTDTFFVIVTVILLIIFFICKWKAKKSGKIYCMSLDDVRKELEGGELCVDLQG